MTTLTYVPIRIGEGFFTDVPVPGSGDDDKALTYDHATGKFVYAAFDPAGTAAAAVAAHVAASDPHTGYLLASGSRASTGAQAFSAGIVAGTIRPASDSTTALRIQDAAGSSNVLTINTVTSAVGIGITPSYRLHIEGAATAGAYIGVIASAAAPGDILNFATTPEISGNLYGFYYVGKSTNGFNNVFANDVGNSTSAHARFEVITNGANGGDPKFVYTISGVRNWCAGIDNSDDDKYKISASDGPGGSDLLTITVTGDVGIGTASPTSKLDVSGTIQADGLRLDVTPTAETITPTHTITFSINGTNYRFPCVAA